MLHGDTGRRDERGKKAMLLVNLIMGADVEQHDLFFRDHDGQGNAITVGYADRLDAGLPAARMMILEMRLKGVFFQIAKE